LGDSLDQRRSFYCSPSEQQTGWCDAEVALSLSCANPKATVQAA
jgi:hypothetical protein